MNPYAANEIIKKAFTQVYGREPTPAERQAAYGVARLETGCGEGWKAGEGQGSHNWGAVQCCRPNPDGECKAGTFKHTDHNRKPSGEMVPYVVCFQAYPDDIAGAADMLRIMFKKEGSPAFEAAATGDTLAVSGAMFRAGYFEGTGKDNDAAVYNHAKALQAGVDVLTTALGEPKALHLRDPNEPAPNTPVNGGPLFLFVAALLGAWKYATRNTK